MENDNNTANSKEGEQSLVKQGEQHSEIVLTYCQSEFCDGEPIEAIPIKEEEPLECPICYRSLSPGKITILDACPHVFCKDCASSWKKNLKKNECPMCRKMIKWTMYVSTRIQSKYVEINHEKHKNCTLIYRISQQYFKHLNEHWLKLIEFIKNSQLETKKLIGVKGIDVINCIKYKHEERLLEGDRKSLAILKSEEGYIEAVYCCYLPNLSIRLVISNEEIDFETDDAAADEAVECLNTQLDACWKVLPKLLSNNIIYKVFIRKFENVICSLALCGNNLHYDGKLHCEPMKEQLGKLKQCNFDSSLFKKRQYKFPPLDRSKLSVDEKVKSVRCCSP